MTQSVFYSFQYEPDNWRVQQVINMGAVSGGAAFTAQDWESVRYKTDSAIESWIRNQMLYTKAVIVLVGGTTSDSRWVRYEIMEAWNDKRPLLGVRIHKLLDRDGRPSSSGSNPFDSIKLKNGQALSDYVPLITPVGSDSKSVYREIQNNLQQWVEVKAYRRS